MVQRYFEDMGVKEIAGASGVPVSTVKTRLARALALLRGRLDARLGGKGTWAVLLLPFLVLELRAAGKVSIAAGAGKLCVQEGVLGMSGKGIVVAVGVSGLLFLGGLGLVRQSLNRVPAPGAGTEGSRAARGRGPGAAEAGSPELAIEATGTSAGRHAPAGDSSRGEPKAAAVPEAEPGVQVDAAEQPSPLVPATPQALALRQAFRALKGKFGDGGRTGWRAVGTDSEIARLQELLLAGPAGLDELLALLDEEKDSSFLEALLHHLPLARTEHRQEVIDLRDLRQELWARFEEAEDPGRRTAFLRFFAYERSLSASRMQDFLALARSEPAAQVRQIAVDAIASHRDLLPDTWEVLAQTFQNDTNSECRENALQGLALAEADGARDLVKAAFTSPDERVRAAAISSAAGDTLPEEVTGGDAPGYLIAELQAARTAGYKSAILKRLVGDPREVYEGAILEALAAERDMGLQKSYREALVAIKEARSVRR